MRKNYLKFLSDPVKAIEQTKKMAPRSTHIFTGLKMPEAEKSGLTNMRYNRRLLGIKIKHRQIITLLNGVVTATES